MDLKHLKDKYAIVGVGYTPQGKVPGRSALSFHVEACANAIKDAGVNKNDIDGLILYRDFKPLKGDISASVFKVAEQLGIRPFTLSQEADCTRTWLTHAIGLLEAKFCKYILVSYGDNGRSGGRKSVNELEGDTPTGEEAAFGDLSTLSKFGMLARRAMYEEGTGPEIWKKIAVAQRKWANLNPRASFYEKIMTYDDYLNSDYIVEPFRLFDATPVTDGGRAIIITSSERAKELANPLVFIKGIGSSNTSLTPNQLLHDDVISGAKIASEMAFKMAGIDRKDVDACQIYDCFTYTVEATLRDYGFFKPGESKAWFEQNDIGPGGNFPVNTSGGLLSEAYFMGLTQVSEAVMQLMGRCGDRQLGVHPKTKAPEIILCSDNGGVFQSHNTLILGRG